MEGMGKRNNNNKKKKKEEEEDKGEDEKGGKEGRRKGKKEKEKGERENAPRYIANVTPDEDKSMIYEDTNATEAYKSMEFMHLVSRRVWGAEEREGKGMEGLLVGDGGEGREGREEGNRRFSGGLFSIQPD